MGQCIGEFQHGVFSGSQRRHDGFQTGLSEIFGGQHADGMCSFHDQSHFRRTQWLRGITWQTIGVLDQSLQLKRE